MVRKVIEVDELPELDFEFAPGWPEPVINAIRELFSFEPDSLANEARLGEALAFSEVPQLVRSIRSLLQDIAEEPWDELPQDPLAGALHGTLDETKRLLDSIQSLDPERERQPKARRDQLVAQLEANRDWYRRQVLPYSRRAPARRAAEKQLQDAAHGDAVEKSRNELKQIRKELAVVREEAHVAAGATASADLSAKFQERADSCGGQAARWLVWLIVSVVATAVLAGLLFWLAPHGDGWKSPEDASRLLFSVLLIGLGIFLVRVCALQHRANRHLQASAQTKAAALSTFTRLIEAADESSRAAVTLAIAQSAFSSEDTGFLDGSADHVTFIDRVAPSLSRPAG